MNRPPVFHRNLWALIVLGLLRERSMHPYEMQRVIRERGKDELLPLKRGSLYHAIERLERAELIEPLETSREGRRPERTTYRITAAGTDELLDWMRDLIARPTPDVRDFVAAIALLPHLTPAEVIEALEMRTLFLDQQLAGLETVLRTLTPKLGRLVLLESELSRALLQAERAWIGGLIEDLRSGAIAWDLEALRGIPGAIPGLTPIPDRDEEVQQ
jgi:DNA-binding PadR family transcriptional regulator